MEKYFRDIDLLLNNIKQIKNKKKVVGFTNGCFDLLHAGHKHLLNEAKQNCDYLVVGINSDSSINLIKGPERPIDKKKKRVENLSKLKCVDSIISFNEKTPLNIIKIIKPNIIFKGSDYKINEIVGSDFVFAYGGDVMLINVLKGISTTEIIKRGF